MCYYKYVKIYNTIYCSNKRLKIGDKFVYLDIIKCFYDDYINPAKQNNIINEFYTFYRKFNCSTLFIILDDKYYINDINNENWLDFMDIPPFITHIIISNSNYDRNVISISGIKYMAPHIRSLLFHIENLVIKEYINFSIALEEFNFKYLKIDYPYLTFNSRGNTSINELYTMLIKFIFHLPPNIKFLKLPDIYYYINYYSFILKLLPSSINELEINYMRGKINLSLFPNLYYLKFIYNSPILLYYDNIQSKHTYLEIDIKYQINKKYTLKIIDNIKKFYIYSITINIYEYNDANLHRFLYSNEILLINVII